MTNALNFPPRQQLLLDPGKISHSSFISHRTHPKLYPYYQQFETGFSFQFLLSCCSSVFFATT